MADVWIMTSDAGEGEEAWKSGVQVVVLPNRKVIAKNDMDKELIEEQIKEAGDISIDELFYYLEGLHKSPYHLGATVPMEEAREYVKLSGGM
jgi:hypothetical protein